jgi:hypothetical protein
MYRDLQCLMHITRQPSTDPKLTPSGGRACQKKQICKLEPNPKHACPHGAPRISA